MLSWLTLAAMGIEGGVAIGTAVVAGPVALPGFGLDRRIEAVASIIVIRRFTGTRLASATSERRAQAVAARTAPGSRARGFRARLRVRAQAWPRVRPAADVLALRQVSGANRGGGTAGRQPSRNGTLLPAAAGKRPSPSAARPATPDAGHRTMRASAISCRSIKISRSFEASPRVSRASQANARDTARYRTRRRSGHRAAQAKYRDLDFLFEAGNSRGWIRHGGTVGEAVWSLRRQPQ